MKSSIRNNHQCRWGNLYLIGIYIVSDFRFSKMRFSLLNQRVTREKAKFPIISDFPILPLRAELHYIERAELLKRRKEIYETIYPLSKPEEQRKKGLIQYRDETVSSRREQPTFTEDTAKKSNLTQRQIQNYIRIAEALPEDVKETVKKINLPMNETYIIYFILHYKFGIIKS